MAIISRGFSGRSAAANPKLPPGQYVTTDFPVLSAGPTEHVPLDQWEFVVDDGASALKRWNWKSFRDLPAERVATVDDFARMVIVATPKAQRLGTHEQFALRFARDDYSAFHSESSRMTRPAIADSTQSVRLPNTIERPRSPGV